MRDKHTSGRLLWYSFVLVVAIGVTVPMAASAQESGGTPSSTILSDATVDIEVSENDAATVNATYTLRIDGAESSEQALSAINGTVNGTLWRFGSTQVQGLSATVNGNEVEPAIQRANRYTIVSIPVESVTGGNTVEVSLSYTVTGTAGQLKTPLVVPEYQTAGTGRAIDLAVTLPEGTQAHGATFPKFDAGSDNRFQTSMLHMPGFVSIDYGAGDGSLLSLDVLAPIVGVVLILGFFGSWMYWTRTRYGGKNVV